jgi:hypothetical protein
VAVRRNDTKYHLQLNQEKLRRFPGKICSKLNGRDKIIGQNRPPPFRLRIWRGRIPCAVIDLPNRQSPKAADEELDIYSE